MNFCALLVGLNIALIGGGIAAWVFATTVPKCLNLPDKPASAIKRVPPWLTGVVERSFFFLLVISGTEGVPEAMIGWVAIKLAANWQKFDPAEVPEAQTRGLLALLTGLVSLGFAYFGGQVACGKWPIFL